MLNPQEEAKREQLKSKCREMKVVPPPDIFIGLQVHKDNKLLFDDVQRGHSWTRIYWNYIFGMTSGCTFVDSSFGAGYISAKRFNDGSMSYQGNIIFTHGNMLTGGEGTQLGIIVGIGSTAFNVDQYQLDTVIVSGSSAGNLYYNASSVKSTTYDAVGKTWTIVGSRIFNNNSGGSIVVAETGLIPRDNKGDITWLFERSLLSPAVTVPDAAQLTVTYTIIDDFSSID